jgi:hypothetical protein
MGGNQPRRDARTGRAESGLVECVMWTAREYIRTRYTPDTEIWGHSKIRNGDRGMLEDTMKRADVVLSEKIKTIVKTWRGYEEVIVRFGDVGTVKNRECFSSLNALHSGSLC